MEGVLNPTCVAFSLPLFKCHWFVCICGCYHLWTKGPLSLGQFALGYTVGVRVEKCGTLVLSSLVTISGLIYIYMCVLHSLVMICGASFHIRAAPLFFFEHLWHFVYVLAQTSCLGPWLTPISSQQVGPPVVVLNLTRLLQQCPNTLCCSLVSVFSKIHTDDDS